jgi:hypothetical protein
MSHGGILTNIPEHFTITFACTPNRTSQSDVEINLGFEDNTLIPLYFKKECDFATVDEEYFNIIYTIYWILLLLIMFFIVSIIYYYIKTNNYTFTDFVALSLEKIGEFYNKIKVIFIINRRNSYLEVRTVRKAILEWKIYTMKMILST